MYFVRTTGIQGNALVFNKTFFNKLGGLDTGMKVWGGEQQELMFKVCFIISLMPLYNSKCEVERFVVF